MPFQRTGETAPPALRAGCSPRRGGDHAQLSHQPERVVLPAMSATEPPPSRHFVAFSDLLLDGHLRVRERGVELREEVFEGLRAAHWLTERGEGNSDVRRCKLVHQAQIARDPDL